MEVKEYRCKEEIILEDIVLKKNDIVDGCFFGDKLIIFLFNGWWYVDKNMFEVAVNIGDVNMERVKVIKKRLDALLNRIYQIGESCPPGSWAET